MKKLIYSMFMLAIAAFTFTSCSDVPMPYDDPNNNTPGGDDPSVGIVDPAGSGTAADPYNVAATLEIIKALDADVQTEPMYVKGKICYIKEVETAQYGNALYYISDDGTDNKNARLYIFQSYYLGNVKFTSEDQIKVGDEVVIYGKFVNYSGNTPETVGKGTSYIYSLNGNTAGGGDDKPTTGEAKGDGTLENPFNSVAANNYTSALPANQNSEKDIYIKGKVVSVKEQFGTQFGNATFYISDDGTSKDQFYVFRALYLGNQKYTEGVLLKEGDEVVVCGKVVNFYGNTPETVQGQAYVYSINGKTTSEGGGSTGGDDKPSGDNLLVNGGFESWNGSIPDNWKSASSASSATLSQSTDAHGGSYSVSVGFNATQNKRLAYKEITLKPGTYVYSFYAKSTTSEPSQCQAGYVPTDSEPLKYTYLGYTSINNNSWTFVQKEFTLAETTTLCLVVMNPKTSSYATAQNILIDDASLTTTNGGLE